MLPSPVNTTVTCIKRDIERSARVPMGRSATLFSAKAGPGVRCNCLYSCDRSLESTNEPSLQEHHAVLQQMVCKFAAAAFLPGLLRSCNKRPQSCLTLQIILQMHTALEVGVPWLVFMLFFLSCAAANALTTSFSKKIPSSLTEGPQDVVVLMFGCCDRC